METPGTKLTARLEVVGGRLSDKAPVTQALQKQAHEILGSIQQQKDDIISHVHQHGDGVLKEARKQKDDGLSQVTKACAKQHDDTMAVLRDIIKEQTRDLLGSFDIREIKHDSLRQQHDAIYQMIDGVQPKPRPGPGQDGYLAQYPAPAGWTQQAYESALVGAAWLFILTLDNPDDGLTGDEDALGVVMTTFPGINEDHFIGALNHVHIQKYGREFQLNRDSPH